mgnify:CR=1 FL=1
MSNDVAFVNYTKRGLKGQTVVTLELFGSPIDCVDGMMSLNAIRKAYLYSIGEGPSSTMKRIDNWLMNSSTVDLIDYLIDNRAEFNYLESQEVKFTIEGRYYGGTYVCRELAHAYAMWLDPRYAAHVLKAFDELVHCNIQSAIQTATKVAKPFIKMEWEARAGRLIALEMEPDEHFRFLVSDIFYEITGVQLDDELKFRNYVYDHIGENLILERMLNALELVWKLKDADDAVEFTVDHFKDDPDFPALVDIIKKYYEDHNFAR